MAFEILDLGTCKAVGTLLLVDAPGNNVLSGSRGISAMVSTSPTAVRCTLVEPIAESEFHALQGGINESSITWVDETHFDIEGTPPDQVIHFAIFRIVGAAFEAPAAGPPLDALPAADRAAMHYAHWWGGQMLSDYLGGWGLAGSGVAPPLEYLSLAALLAYEPGTTRVGLETRDQSGNARHLVCADPALQGILVTDTDVPTLDGNGSTLAISMPAGIGVRYTRADILGLAADDSAFSIFWAADQSQDQYGAAFIEGDPADAFWPWAGYASDTPPTYGDASCWPSSAGLDPQAETAWEPLTEPVGKGSWFGFVMPAGGTTATARFYVNGVLQPTRIELFPGAFSLADADSFAWFLYNTGAAVDASACVVFQREIVGAGFEVVRQFFESLRTP